MEMGKTLNGWCQGAIRDCPTARYTLSALAAVPSPTFLQKIAGLWPPHSPILQGSRALCVSMGSFIT